MSNKYFKVFYDNQELTDIIDVLEGFSIPLMPEFENYTQKIDFIDGEQWIGQSFNGKKLSIPFQIVQDLDVKRDQLVKLLRKKELKKLSFSNFPNRYYNAIIDGSTEINESKQIIKGELVFLVPDGVSHSTTKKEVVFAKNADGILEATLENNGTDDAIVDFEITMNHENGYVGIVSDQGVIEIGNRNELDEQIATKSVILTNNKNGNFSNWVDTTTFYENATKKSVKSMETDSNFGGRMGIINKGFTNTANSSYFGAMKEFVITEPASDWYLWSQAWFETGLMGQTGMWTIVLIDENNNQIAAMHIYKTDTFGNTAHIRFTAADGNGIGKTLKDFTFTPSYWIPPNPYGSQSRDTGRNPFDILKEGNKLRFFWNGSYFTYVVPQVSNMKVKRIQFFVGQFKGRNTTNQMVTHMYINNLLFIDNKSQYWQDVPNKYPQGSTIYINGTERKPYYNNMLRLEDEVVGSTYFRIPPGNTKVLITCSDFSTPLPTAKAYINEVYL